MGSTNFGQDDIDTLFKIDFGCAGVIDANLASRLIISMYIEDREPLRGTASYVGLNGKREIGLTHQGRTFLASIRDGVETRWQEWKP